MDDLREEWKTLYAKTLPALARAKDKHQESWPVMLDHCFGRIVLDNAVGKDKPWAEVLKAPAIKHMTEEQLNAAIKLGQAIADGSADINELNERSLELRGKQGPPRKRKAEATGRSASPKRVKEDEPSRKQAPTQSKRSESGNISTYFLPSPQSPKKEAEVSTVLEVSKKAADEDMDVQLQRIADSNLTSFRKLTLSLLCQVPRGRYTSYQAMSDYITESSHKTCARAVGSAMRNNPFAPEVPCHRVLANDGSLGGFGGHWGEDGKFASKKHEILHDEGVRFDSRGKAKGPPFRDFKQVT